MLRAVGARRLGWIKAQRMKVHRTCCRIVPCDHSTAVVISRLLGLGIRDGRNVAHLLSAIDAVGEREVVAAQIQIETGLVSWMAMGSNLEEREAPSHDKNPDSLHQHGQPTHDNSRVAVVVSSFDGCSLMCPVCSAKARASHAHYARSFIHSRNLQPRNLGRSRAPSQRWRAGTGVRFTGRTFARLLAFMPVRQSCGCVAIQA